MNNNPTREKILLAATRLFHLRGYHAIGLSQIIKEAGVPKGSFYHYFPEGKEQLAIEAIQISAKQIGKEIQHFFSQTDTPLEAINRNIQYISELFERPGGIHSETFSNVPFGLLAMESAFENEKVRKVCEEAFLYWESIYEERFVAAGYELQRAKEIASLVNVLIEGGVVLALTKKSSEPLVHIQGVIPLLLSN